MKYLPYVFKHLKRNWIRSASTIAAMGLCIFLFCTLQTFLGAVESSLEGSSARRLVSRHRVSLAQVLPLSYKQRLLDMEGVTGVANATWFGGSLKAKKEDQSGEEDGDGGAPDFMNFFANFGIDPEDYLAIHPEYLLSEEQRRDFFGDRRAALIGRGLSKRFGWEIGDTFFLESFIPPYRKADGPFEFIVRAIYDIDDAQYQGTDPNLMFFHFEYLYEGVNRNAAAGTYVIEIADPTQAAQISEAIDARFENSDAETLTETESAFRASFLSIAGNLALFLNGIGLAVAFTILLVTANTMSMAFRERRTEIAVLKTLGFPSKLVMGLMLGESVLIGTLGGGLGVGLGWLLINGAPNIPAIGDMIRSFGFRRLALDPMTATLGAATAIMLALVAGAVPATLAYKARITDMLRQV